jgi:putative redox protein
METKHIALAWTGGLRFEGGEPGGPQLRIDGDNAAAPGPMLAVLLAAASCSAADVVDILAKMRAKLGSLDVEAWGDRRDEPPRRFIALRFRFRVRGDGLDEAKVRRAIDLSLEKYCSVMHSLAPDIPVSYELDLGRPDT